MKSFITQTLQELLSREPSISDYTFILPSKRAGSFLSNQLSMLMKEPVFSPKILSIEDFAEEMSGLKAMDATSALFEFYSVYLQYTPEENRENFETFSSWAQTLLHDFNEIDRYLIDYRSFFNYLSEIQEMNHWYLQDNKTPLMQNYLRFWKNLPFYYEQLRNSLEHKQMAYQGMVYRTASEKVDDYLKAHQNPHVFLGFNALNEAEQIIVQRMLEAGTAEIFWDIDEVFLNDTQHEASLFIREYRKTWPYYREKPLETVSQNFSQSKNIEMIGVPKNIGQAKYVGELLANLSTEELKNTAVVLGDESLLLPILNSLPPNVQEINVTMGFPLKYAPVSFLFQQLFSMHSFPKDELYYKDVLAIVSHPLFLKLSAGETGKIAEQIQKENRVYIKPAWLFDQLSEQLLPIFKVCFGSWDNEPVKAVSQLQKLVFLLKEKMDRETDKLGLEFLYQYHLIFNKLGDLLQSYPYLTTIKSLASIFKELISSQTVDFRGKPFTGLQLMGMLESRVLDFKNVILTSVNEGVLPAGKSSNSFIPFDLKCSYKLPTYKEKDAVYTYHFYHLLQRATNIHLLYNTESGGLSAGERSRFLLQLEMEQLPAHNIRKYSVSPYVPGVAQSLRKVWKTPEMLEILKKRAAKGFSPSALTTYIRNPLDFYQQYILGIREAEEIEETIAYNTLGTVVHQTLETFYKDWVDMDLRVESLEEAIKMAPQEVSRQFENVYAKQPLSHGKNLLIFEVAKRYVLNFLRMEIDEIKKGNSIRIKQVEASLRSKIPIEELDFPIYIQGVVDRVDYCNGRLRIIDYKTGKVAQNQVEIEDWDLLTSDYDKYSKSFQILAYANMLHHESPISSLAEAGIISFKNLKSGFLKFTKKENDGKKPKKNPEINASVLQAFEEQLKKLILEICDPEIPFQEKEIPQKLW